MPDRDEITALLKAHASGDGDAFERLVPLVYQDLHRIARGQLRRHRAGDTLNTTALVHEAYFQLVDERSVDWRERGHFFAIAARSMRRIIVDHARERCAQKRGGGHRPVTLEPDQILVDEQAGSLLAVNQALETLGAVNERMASIVECRFFAGLTEEETSAALGISLRTVQRDWRRAKAWLRRELESAPDSNQPASSS